MKTMFFVILSLTILTACRKTGTCDACGIPSSNQQSQSVDQISGGPYYFWGAAPTTNVIAAYYDSNGDKAINEADSYIITFFVTTAAFDDFKLQYAAARSDWLRRGLSANDFLVNLVVTSNGIISYTLP